MMTDNAAHGTQHQIHPILIPLPQEFFFYKLQENMTVTAENDHHGRPYVGSGQPETFLPQATAESTASATESHIPFAKAVLVDDAPSAPVSYNPENAGPTSSATAMTSASGTPGVNVTVSVSHCIPQASAATSDPAMYTASTAPVPAADATPHVQGTTTRPPPPGVPPGGRWVKLERIGGNTWLICAIISGIFCLFTCFPCGVFAFCCPCDEGPAYLVNGKLFDEDGGMIGSSRSRGYR